MLSGKNEVIELEKWIHKLMNEALSTKLYIKAHQR